MRCIHCGKRLAVLRKLTDGEFCSSAHRKQFQLEQEQLALARLLETQERLQAERLPRELEVVTQTADYIHKYPAPRSIRMQLRFSAEPIPQVSAICIAAFELVAEASL